MASSIKDQSEVMSSRQEDMLKAYDRKARVLEKKVRQNLKTQLILFLRFHPEFGGRHESLMTSVKTPKCPCPSLTQSSATALPLI